MTGKKDILSRLSQAVIEYNASDAAFWASTAIEAGIDPTEALDALMDAIRQIGRQFARGELFLPDLVMSGEAMQAGAAILEAEIKQAASSPRARTLSVGTVAENLHDIGRSLMGTVFLGAGYRVIDLGIDVPASRFPEAVRLYEPDLLGLSA